MKTTLNEFLPYPEDNDFGNGALDLQVLAEAIDTKLSAMITQFTYFSRRETCVVTSSVDSSAIGAGSGINLSFDTILYNNGYTIDPVTGIPTPPRDGSYMAGAYANCQVSAGTTARSQRQLDIQIAVPSGPIKSQRTFIEFVDTVYDSAVAGGDFLSVQGLWDFQSFDTNPLSEFFVTFRHENLAGNMVAKAGYLLWVTRISDLET